MSVYVLTPFGMQNEKHITADSPKLVHIDSDYTILIDPGFNKQFRKRNLVVVSFYLIRPGLSGCDFAT